MLPRTVSPSFTPILVLTSIVALGLFGFPRQTCAQTDFRVGVQAGLTAMTEGGLEVEVNRRIGFTAGGFAVIGFRGPVALRTHLVYAQKGFVLDGADAEIRDSDGNLIGEMGDITTRRDYVELQLPIEVQKEMGSLITSRLFGGPTVGINVNSEVEYVGSGFDNRVVDQDETTNDYETGLLLGGGISLDTPRLELLLEIFYQLGLSEVNRQVGPDGELEDLSLISFSPDERNRGLVARLGLVF